MSKKHRAVTQKQFTKTLDAFTEFAVRDTREDVEARIALVRPQPGEMALDVACGPGTLVLALAPRVGFARGIDITPAMLNRARERQRELGLANVAFELGDAEQLPYADAAFDLVCCQFAFHHMTAPEIALREMLRVLRPAGRIMIVDSVAPESDEKWDLRHRIETLRDPSHTAAFRLTAFLSLFDRLGLQVQRQRLKGHTRSFDQWMLRAGLEPSGPRYREIRKLLEDSMPADGAGYSATPHDGDILITQHEVTFVVGSASV